MNLNLGSFNREQNHRSSRSGFISGLCVVGNPRKNQILVWNKLEEQTSPFNQENTFKRLLGEVSPLSDPDRPISCLQPLSEDKRSSVVPRLFRVL